MPGRILHALLVGLIVMILLPLVPLVGMSALRLFSTKGLEWGLASVQLIAIVPLLLIVAGTIFASLGTLRKARARVELAAAAVPPLREGEPHSCRVCGAPLRRQGVRGVARCDYCAADNVVDPAVLGRASAQRVEILEDYAAEVERQSGAATKAFGRGALMLITGALLSPFLCVLPTLLVGVFLWAIGIATWAVVQTNQPPTPGNRYGLVDVPEEGRCVAWFNPYTDRWERGGEGATGPDAVFAAGDVEELTLEALLGQRLRIIHASSHNHGFEGVASDPGWFSYKKRDGEILDGPDAVHLTRGAESVSSPLWHLLSRACFLPLYATRGAPRHRRPVVRRDLEPRVGPHVPGAMMWSLAGVSRSTPGRIAVVSAVPFVLEDGFESGDASGWSSAVR